VWKVGTGINPVPPIRLCDSIKKCAIISFLNKKHLSLLNNLNE